MSLKPIETGDYFIYWVFVENPTVRRPVGIELLRDSSDPQVVVLRRGDRPQKASIIICVLVSDGADG